jgi:hypothetical protein
MKIGLKIGSRGARVGSFQRVLSSAGYQVGRREVDRREFGPSTLAALQAFQSQHGLRRTKQINKETLQVLLALEERITVNINGAAPTPTQPDEHRGIVKGKLVDEDGAPIAGTKVSLVSKTVRSEAQLGAGKTDQGGQYTIHYHRAAALNLIVRAVGARGKVLAASATVFSAPAEAEIDITTATNGVVPSPSRFTILKAQVTAQLHGASLDSLQEDQETHEVQFLANAIGAPFREVAYLFVAYRLAIKNKLSDATLFGIFYQGIPPSLAAALGNLPDAGIDDTFTAQALSGVLAHARSSLTQALTGALTANVLPASYAATQDAQLTQIDVLRRRSVGNAPYIRGKTSLNDLLAAGGVADAVKAAFVEAYADNGGESGATWKVLRANKNLPKGELTTLDTTLTVGELLSGNLPLVRDTLSRLSQGSLANVRSLALLDQSDWEARIKAVDPQATSIRSLLKNDSPALRITMTAVALVRRFASRYPTTAFAGGLTKATASSFATKTELASVLTANPSLDIKRTNLDQFIMTKKLTVSAPALAELKTAQRLFRISPHYATVEALKTAGYQSAQGVYLAGRTNFVAQMTPALGSASLANAAYARAQTTYATALATFGQFNLALNGVSIAAMASPVPDPSTLANLPSLQALFGSLDYCQCTDCRSVYSPAAYLVDLLQFLYARAATGLFGNARDVLLSRRPDIQYVALNCNNTNVTVPYIDVVNELFESLIVPPAPPVAVIDTLGTSDERRALPQQVLPAPYDLTKTAVFPLSLPFDLSCAQTSAFLTALGLSRGALLTLFRGSPAGPSGAAIAGASLGISTAMQGVINTSDTVHPWERWGLAQAPAFVVDPKTRELYSPTPADWIAALGKIPVLLSRAGLTFQQLCQLLEVVWVTASSVTLQAGTTPIAGASPQSPFQLLTCDLDAMTFTGLTAEVLDRANRFLRLWTATGLQMWELDWAFGPTAGAPLDDTFLAFLSGAISVGKQLNLPFQEVLTFWRPLETRDVTNHLGDEDTIVPSTYSEVFCNPTMRASWSAVFPAGGALVGSAIIVPSLPPPTPAQSANVNALAAALPLSKDDISAILEFTGVANALTLETLNVLLRYARLASSLSLDIPDLILWIQLTGGGPFGGAPTDTLEFLRRLSLLQATGLGVRDLDYLLRDQSASQSALAFTPTEATAVLQTIRDAVAKVAARNKIPVTGASNASPIAISTAQPNGLLTGMQVSVSGVLGNSAANGTFTITVSGATTFTLDGSAGNGAWTSGGAVTSSDPTAVQAIVSQALANDPATIQTIVVQGLATAAGVTANVVTPTLLKTGVLPLDAATIGLLLGETAGVDPTKFPQLVNAFTSVAKASVLFTALHPTEAEFAFLVQNAASFNWLDPSALPLAPTDVSPYGPFEALVRALKLDQRQSARDPKLFDVLAEWLTALPPDVPTAIGGGTTNPPPLAEALNASVADVSAIATALSAQAPSFDPTKQSGTLCDMAMLTSIAAALDSVRRYGISGATLVQLAASPPTPDTATVAMGVFQAQYPQSAWFAAVQPVEDGLRQSRRDALVAFMLGQGPTTITAATNTAPIAINTAAPHGLQTGVEVAIAGALGNLAANGTFSIMATGPTSFTLDGSTGNGDWTGGGTVGVATLGASTSLSALQTTDDLFDYYLIDPEMCACGITTRLLQASLTIQQFVQQCYLNLVPQVTTSSDWDEWSWMQQFRLWQANRQVFLYPENYLLPELRTDKSSFFTDLESDLRQSNCDADAATAALENYLRKLVEVSNLVVSAHHHETKPDGSRVLHVFAHTRGTPYKWFYRTRTESTSAAWAWSAWEPLKLDITSDHLLPVVWGQRLHLVWASFNQISEVHHDQNIPTSSAGGTASAPTKYWAIEFSTSERSAGQWQPKRTIKEKMFDAYGYSSTDYFTFRAWEGPSSILQIDAYWSGYWGMAVPIGSATLSMPDAPLLVTEYEGLAGLPPELNIDPVQEPSFSLITWVELVGASVLATPSAYHYSAQELIYGPAVSPNPGIVPLSVLYAATAKGPPAEIQLLGTIPNPHVTPSQADGVFQSSDLFFVKDDSRTYLVQPSYYSLSSAPVELGDAYLSQWKTRYAFTTFHHPFSRTFLRELEIGGIDQLMRRDTQLNPEQGATPFDFNAVYRPTPVVVLKPYPTEEVSFETSDPNAPYNWELFYHAPMFVASLLMQNQRYQDAITWLEYIFNPTDPTNTAVPAHYWQTKPFYLMNAADWLSQQIQNILTASAATPQGSVDAAAIQDWIDNPFDPHRVAKLRIGAYGKATAMKFLDNLIAWGDSLYSQYTMETVGQAMQLYVFAELILGPQPAQVRLPDRDQSPTVDALTYASIASSPTGSFSDPLVEIENVILAPTPVLDSSSPSPTPSLPTLVLGTPEALLFCIPPNEQLLAYWDTVADRLYKIRHCLNMQGIAQPLPLYAPPLNPLSLIERQANGGAAVGGQLFTPVYRFATYLQKAQELTNEVRAYGALILTALEKKDAEALAVLRANQDLNIQTLLLDVKTSQVAEATDQIAALQNQKAVVQVRLDFYSNRPLMNATEAQGVALRQSALVVDALAVAMDTDAGQMAKLPSLSIGMEGFGGTPSLNSSWGGQNIAASSQAFSAALKGSAGMLTEQGGISSTSGGYQQRQDEWNMQAQLATAELTQLASQIAAANDRLAVANSELSLQNQQITNAQAVSDFLTNKYTNEQLYDWMLTQLTTVYTQAYQLAFSLAQRAQAAFQYELGTDESFIQFGYWTSQFKGLTAGESLLFDLRRMEAQFLAENTRELELTKHVSLALTQPLALVQLVETGTCNIALDEALFDRDHPGHYFRRLRSVAVTIPCVTGPYTGVNATLVLNQATVRVKPPVSPYQPASAAAPPATSAFVSSAAPATATIATSSGQNDAGLHDVNLRDERWLPFEGQGAISTWSLVLDQRDNNFDLSTITDVVLHVRYTARSSGGDPEAVRTALALAPQRARSILVSVRNTFGDAYYSFFNPADSTATQQTLNLPITAAIFPFSNLGSPKLTNVKVCLVLAQSPAVGTAIAATFGATGGTANALPLAALTGTTAAGKTIAALTGDAALAPPASPEAFTLTVPQASVPSALSTTTNGQLLLDAKKVEDIVLIITYSIA